MQYGKQYLLAAATIVSLTIGASCAAWAAGVLLPSDNQSGTSSNLGLVPVPQPVVPPTDPKSPSLPQGNGKICTGGGCTPADAADNLVKQGSPLSNQAAINKALAVAPVIPMAINPGGKMEMSLAESMNKAAAARGLKPVQQSNVTALDSDPRFAGLNANIKTVLAQYHKDMDALTNKPPVIINERPVKTRNPNGTSPPYHMNVAVDRDYIWGRNDTMLIEKWLGYPREQISNNCQLRVGFNLTTDKGVELPSGMYSSKVFAGQRGVIQYDGKITSISLSLMAVCNPPKGELPKKGGVLTKIGEKYGVSLPSMGNCPLSGTAIPTILEVKYEGSKGAQCKSR